MPKQLHTTYDLSTFFHTASPSSLTSVVTGSLTHLRITPAKQAHFPPSILIEASESYTPLVVPGLVLPVFTSYGDLWEYAGVWRVNSRRPLSQWVVVGLEHLAMGEDPVVKSREDAGYRARDSVGDDDGDDGGRVRAVAGEGPRGSSAGGSGRREKRSTRAAAEAAFVESKVNQWSAPLPPPPPPPPTYSSAPPPAPSPPPPTPPPKEKIRSREREREPEPETPLAAPGPQEMIRADSETIGDLSAREADGPVPVAGPTSAPSLQAVPMHIPVIPPPPPPHMSKPSMPERVHSSGKIKKKQHQQLMQQDEEWKLPTPPLASPGISGTPDGYTDVSGPGEVMAASLSESNFLPMRESVEDDESDRWSVLSTGPVDRQWTMVFEEKDEVV